MFSQWKKQRAIEECPAHGSLQHALEDVHVFELMCYLGFEREYRSVVYDLTKHVGEKSHEIYYVLQVALDTQFTRILQQFQDAQRTVADSQVFPTGKHVTFPDTWKHDYELSGAFQHIYETQQNCVCGHHRKILAPTFPIEECEEFFAPQDDPILSPVTCSSRLLEEELGDDNMMNLPGMIADELFDTCFYDSPVKVRVLTPDTMTPYWQLLPRLSRGRSTPTLILTHQKNCEVYGENLTVLSYTKKQKVWVHHNEDSYKIRKGVLKQHCPTLYHRLVGNNTPASAVNSGVSPVELGDMRLDDTMPVF